MEKDTELIVITDGKQNKPYLFQKGQSGNPNGRPTGAEGFATKWRRAIEKIGDKTNMTVDEIEQELLFVGYDKARKGDYRFYQDAFDRVYGKPQQSLDHTTKGERINCDSLTVEQHEALNKMLNDK